MGDVMLLLMITLISLAFIIPSRIESVMILKHEQQIELLQNQQCNNEE